jgi:hypothetical protein
MLLHSDVSDSPLLMQDFALVVRRNAYDGEKTLQVPG